MKFHAYLPLIYATLAPFVVAQPKVFEPASDVRIIDSNGDGLGDSTHGGDEGDSLNVGDNRDGQVWRSVLKFSVGNQRNALAPDEIAVLVLTVKANRLLESGGWVLRVVHVPDAGGSSRVRVASGGTRDDYSIPGEVLRDARPVLKAKPGDILTLDVTEQVRADLAAGRSSVFRLELEPGSNGDQRDDQVVFYAGSHEANPPDKRPRLQILAR